MFRRAWVLAAFAAGAVLSCGGDDDEGGSSTGGTGGAAGSGTGGAAGGTTGGAGGSGGGLAGSGGGGDAASCGDLGQTTECKACLAQKCCKAVADCGAEKDCNDFVTCARACPDQTDTGSACMQACIAAHNAGGANYNGAFLCLLNECDAPCGYL